MRSEGDRAIALLRYANYQKVGRALHVSRSAVADWAKGKSVTPYRLTQLEQLLRPDLQIEEAPMPEWARGLEAKIVAELGRNRQLIEALALPADIQEAAARVIERLEALEPPGDVAPNGIGGSAGQGALARRDRELG